MNRFQLNFEKHILQFKQPSGTSRGILTEKKCWILTLTDSITQTEGKGECSIIEGLSPEYTTDSAYEDKLSEVQHKIDSYIENPLSLNNFPSILMGLEMCIFDVVNGGNQIYFPSSFTKGETSIPINGLVWMGDLQFMRDQVNAKLEQGFSCIKMKVGAIDFEQELKILEQIREQFSADQITLRVDANGSFTASEALSKLQQLAQFNLHSIEQPIAAGQRKAMLELCKTTPLPIALDEELIGISLRTEREQLLDEIQPQYIILKPSLHGGFSGSREWIELADKRNIGWWITSALESNIGLNAIAQFAGMLKVTTPQGLGTGGLFVSNFESPLVIEKGELKFQKQAEDIR